MRYRNNIFIIICCFTLAFATVSTSILIKGNLTIGISNDFDVYFSDVKVNGVQDLLLVKNESELVFNTILKSKDETYEVEYDVTNGSKNYDAKIEMNCTSGNEYLSVSNSFDTVANLVASETRSGILTIKLRKQYTGDSLETTVSCTISGTAVERTELENETPAIPVEKCEWVYNDLDNSGSITTGDEYTYCTEGFNVIDSNSDVVNLFSKKNIGVGYKQSDASNSGAFSNNIGWKYAPGPKEIDIQAYDGNVKFILNAYVDYLRKVMDNSNITGDLITLKQLGDLGCTYNSDYSWSANESTRYCRKSEYSSWLINDKYFWTKSAYSKKADYVWYMDPSGILRTDVYTNNIGVRVVVTIPIDILNN